MDMNTFEDFTNDKSFRFKVPKISIFHPGSGQCQPWIWQGEVLVLYLGHLFDHIPSILRHFDQKKIIDKAILLRLTKPYLLVKFSSNDKIMKNHEKNEKMALDKSY